MSSELHVIAIAGVRGSGKHTVGSLLREKHDFAPTSFAKPIKQMAAIAFPQITNTHLYGPTSAREEELDTPLRGLDPVTGEPMIKLRAEADTNVMEHVGWEDKDGTVYRRMLTPRLILQTLGTEWGRRLHANIWVDACWGWILKDAAVMRHDRYCITDCRFRNEIEGTRQKGGKVIRLQRGFEAAKKKLARGEAATVHPSESELLSVPDEEFDYIVDNTGPLENLPGLMVEALKALGITP